MLEIKELTITEEILQSIAEIDEFKGEWKLLGRLSPERLTRLRQVATIESIGSSTRIEGSKLTDQQVELLLKNININSFKSRDEEEVAGYAELMQQVFSDYEAIPLTENFVKQMHGILLKHCHKDQRHRGEYKKVPNSVEAFDALGRSVGVIFETSSPFETPREMEELISWTQNSLQKKTHHPLLITAVFIVAFLAIHPFQDGNGRLSRILTTLLLLKNGYAYVPYSSLESIVEDNKEEYYLALRRCQTTLKDANPNWTPWFLFFLRSLQKQKDRLKKKIQEEQIILSPLSQLSIQIMDMAKDYGKITVYEVVQLTGANRNTIKKHLAHLVKQDYLVRNGSGKGSWYSLK